MFVCVSMYAVHSSMPTCTFIRICVHVHFSMCQVHICEFGYCVSVDRYATSESVDSCVCVHIPSGVQKIRSESGQIAEWLLLVISEVINKYLL